MQNGKKIGDEKYLATAWFDFQQSRNYMAVLSEDLEALKRQCQEIFGPWFFHQTIPLVPDEMANAILNFAN
jgi:hypothetical protein